MTIEVRSLYHVPRSQVWEGSRGKQRGNLHLHVTKDVILGRIRRRANESLCGRNGWYMREPYPSETIRCPRCAEIAERNGITWPEATGG